MIFAQGRLYTIGGVYTLRMDAASTIENSLLSYLDEETSSSKQTNFTTLLHQGQVAQEWLLTAYLGAWLQLIGDLVDCGYPTAENHAGAFLAVSRLKLQIDPGITAFESIFFLEHTQNHIKSLAKNSGAPTERSMQWGIWARDVAMAITHGFVESGALDPVVCESLAPCCMYAAFVVSQVVTDEGVAEEIAEKMFEMMPRELLEIIRRLPVAPEA